jgi:integrase
MMAKKKEERKTKNKANGLGTIWERKNGKWSWQVTLGYDQDGKRIARAGTEKDKTSAAKALAAAITAHSKGQLALPGRTTLNEYAERWLKRQKVLAQTTQMAYKHELNLILKYLGKLNLRDVRTQHVRDALAKLADSSAKKGLGAGKPFSSRTLAHVRTRLRAVFREAVTDGLIALDPTLGVKRIKVYRTENEGIALDFDQVARFHELGEAVYAAGVCRLWYALFTAISIGLRRGEVMGLRWCDVDLERNMIRVEQNLTCPGGKLEMRRTKTEAGTREIVIPASLKVALERHRFVQLAEQEASGVILGRESPVFATSLGTYTHPDNLNRALRELLAWSDAETRPRIKKNHALPIDDKATNLERRMLGVSLEHRVQLRAVILSGKALPPISPHDLRHTAGTLMLRRGMPVEVVSKILGHTRVSITLDIYRHVLESEKRQQVVDLFEMPLPKRFVERVSLN